MAVLATQDRPTAETVAPSLAAIRRWPSLEAKRWTEQFVAMACRDPHVLAVVAFGSAVRAAGHSADIDLLIIYEREPPPLPPHPMDVDIRAFSRASLDSKVCEGHDLLGWVIRFGEVVYERGGFWTTFREQCRGRVSLPSADVAEERAKRSFKLYRNLLEIGDADAAAEQLLVTQTQSARSCLIRAGIYPASRPELPAQLRLIGENDLAAQLDHLLRRRVGD